MRRYDHGRVLIGGEPLRALRLTESGARAIDRLSAGLPATGDGATALARRLLDGGLAHPSTGLREPAGEATIAIPVRDDPMRLARCLTALDGEAPVVVVDDGSADAVATAAVCAEHHATLIRRDRSGGPAAARNTALRAVDTPLVAFLDSDCVPKAGWLTSLLGHFDDSQVAVVAPRVRPAAVPDGAGPASRFAAVRSPLDMGAAPARVRPGGRVSYVPTAALVVRRDAVGDGFDEDLRFGEDVDLVWRLHDDGWAIRYEPSATVWHSEPPRWRDLVARRFRYGTSAGPLAERHPDRLAPVTVRPMTPAAAGRLLNAAVPSRAVATLTARAALGAVEQAGRAATMLAPGLLLAGLARRHTRVAAATLLAGPPLLDWARRRPALDPVRWAALTVADDVAYGAGVWAGAVRARTTAPLRPDLLWRPPATPSQSV